jgi:hypothetical protein
MKQVVKHSFVLGLRAVALGAFALSVWIGGAR